MNIVKGVYDRKKQTEMHTALNMLNSSLALLWLVGVSTGYRVSDLLSMRAYSGKYDTLTIIEAKTGKTRIVRLPKRVAGEMCKHVRDNTLDDLGHFLFFGRDRSTPITRQHAHRVFRSVGLSLGLDAIGTHSMRKTYAYNVLVATKSFQHVQFSLNHTYLSTTILYLIDGLTALLPKPGRLGIPPVSVVATSLPG